MARNLMVLVAFVALGLMAANVSGETVQPTSFDQVAARLETGGAFYGYMSTAQWFKKLEQTVVGLQEMAVASGDLGGDDLEAVQKGFAIALRVINDCGLRGMSGIGVSSVEIAPGVYRNRTFIHHFPGQGTGYFWQIGGGRPHPLAILRMLPDTTVLAASSDLDIPMLWKWVSGEISRSGFDEATTAFENWRNGLAAMGVDLDQQIASLGGEIGLILTLDPTQEIEIPGPTPVKVAEPALALLIRVKDLSLFDLIKSKTEGFLTVLEDGAVKRMGGMKLPVPFVTVQPTVVQTGEFLIICSNNRLANSILAATKGEKLLVDTEAFAQIADGIPLEGNSFTFVSPELRRTIQKAQAAVLSGTPDMTASQLATFQKLFGQDRDFFIYSVSQHAEDGWLSVGKSTVNAGQAVLMQAAIVPAAIMAGVALPAFTKARGKAQGVACMSNLRQIGLGLAMFQADWEAFPEAPGAAGLNALLEKGYIADGNVFICPKSGQLPAAEGEALNETSLSYCYLGGMDLKTVGVVPVAFDKPGYHDGFVNVLFTDCHVERVEGVFSSPLAVIELLNRRGDYSAEAKTMLLERARGLK